MLQFRIIRIHIIIILVVLLALCMLDQDAMRIGSDVLLH